MKSDSAQQQWNQRWLNGQTGWDLRSASPPLCAYCLQIPVERRNLRLLIPGCGNAYEALFLLEQGFSDITLIDIAPAAVEIIRQRFDAGAPEGWAEKVKIVCGDFFEHQGVYDLILEQTFFCALDPALRHDYVVKMNELLAPGGRLAGVLFDRDFEGGPPFGGSRDEYESLFAPQFTIKTLAAGHNSVAPRAGTEVFVILEKKG
ncbi:MAG: methyltransferase domain-containing protein [Saprospiraceae bacterium]|nr:methyltransferase domain-containing protein [Saprospiraceae bacterium]